MKMIRQLTSIPHFMTITICIFIILPLGIYSIYDENKWHTENIKENKLLIESWLETGLRQKTGMYEELFHHYKIDNDRFMISFLKRNHKNISNVLNRLLKKRPSDSPQNVLDDLPIDFPVYVLDKSGKPLARSGVIPESLLKNRVRFLPVPEKDIPFKVSAPTGESWFVIEKKLSTKPYTVGVFLAEAEMVSDFRNGFVEYMRYLNDPLHFQFVINTRGEFIVNESDIFPGRAITTKNQQALADTITQQILGSDKTTGKMIAFSWTIPDIKPEKRHIKKIFVRYNPALDFYIGTGMDLEEMKGYYAFENDEIKKYLNRGLNEFLVLLVVIFVFLLLFGRQMTRKTQQGFTVFSDFFEKANESHEPIDTESLPYDEFRSLAGIANEMVKDRKQKQTIILAYMKKLQEANRQLKDMADRDGLTGIPNRRFFDDALKKSWQDAMRNTKPISLGMIDIDFFKQYNDTYGHQMGDECLIIVAKAISGSMKRPYDLAARYGGEEFVVLFPDTDKEGALKIASQIKEAVSESNIPHKASGVSTHVTFSMGLATLVPDRDSAPESIVLLADNALYKAKEAGRNRINSA